MPEQSQAKRDLANDLWRRSEQCFAETRLWEPTWRELAEFIRPNKKRAGEVRTPGGKQTDRLYDPTAPNANRKLANFLNGTAISHSTRFFTLVTADLSLMKSRDVAIWLEDAANRMHSAFQQSNLNAIAPQAFASLGALGTAGIFMDERDPVGSGFGGFQFTVIPLGQFACDENAMGEVNVLYRDFQLSTIAAVSMFGESKDLPLYLKEGASSTPYQKHWFRQCIMPREGMPSLKSSRLPYASLIIDHKERVILREKGYHELPFFVPRWDIEEGEIYGRGPGHIALPDIRTLNKVKQLGLEALALQVRPPLQVPQDGILGGTARLTPAAQNVMMNGAEIKPLDLGHDLKSEMVKGEELRNNIQSCFHRDIVDPLTKNYMTATEVIKNLELVHMELGPTMGNIQTGWFKPMISRGFNMMLRANAFLPVPQELAEADLDIEYEGPLARAQRTGDITALQTCLSLVAVLNEVDQTAMDNIDIDEVVNYQADVLGVPKNLLRSKAAKDKIRESRAQAAQMQSQIEQAQGMMDVASTGAQAGKTMREAMQPQGTA